MHKFANNITKFYFLILNFKFYSVFFKSKGLKKKKILIGYRILYDWPHIAIEKKKKYTLTFSF